jgi:hypothetical protein
LVHGLGSRKRHQLSSLAIAMKAAIVSASPSGEVLVVKPFS